MSACATDHFCVGSMWGGLKYLLKCLVLCCDHSLGRNAHSFALAICSQDGLSLY